MMFPYLSPVLARKSRAIEAFGGLCLTEARKDGQLSACKNLSFARYPLLSPCRPPVKLQSCAAPDALWAGEQLLVIDGGAVTYGGREVGRVSPGPKQLAALGRWVVIFPDKMALDTQGGSLQTMEPTRTLSGLTFDRDRVTLAGADWPFAPGDAVTISGCALADNNKTPVVQSVEGDSLIFHDNTFLPGRETGAVTLKRTVPDLEHICVWGGRLWGTAGDLIHGSKYDDPMNFSVFEGLADDSYFVRADTPGPFTGIMGYTGHLCLFKEEALHKLYGSAPRNFQLLTNRVQGVRAGCHRALCRMGEQLLYLSRRGVMAYSGGLPRCISEDLGELTGQEACAAGDGRRYYLSLVAGNTRRLLVWDSEQGGWLEQTEGDTLAMTSFGGQVLCLRPDGVYALEAGDLAQTEWQADLGPFVEGPAEDLCHSRLILRAHRGEGSQLQLLCRLGDGPWQPHPLPGGSGVLQVRLPPATGSPLTLRLQGRGDAAVRSVVREFYPAKSK